MMRAIHGCMRYNKKAEYLYGRELLKDKNPVLKEFLLKEQANADKIFERLKDSETESALARIQELNAETKVRKEALAYYEM